MRKGYLPLLAAAVLGQWVPGIASAQDAVRLGMIFPTRTIIGTQSVQGAEIAVKMINEAGGTVDGRPVELVVYDTNYSPAEGVAAVQRLLTQDGVKYVLGEISSTVALAVIPVIEGEDALAMFSIPKHPAVTQSGYDRVFRLNSTSVIDAQAFDRLLVEEVNPDKVAVLVQNDDLGLLTLEGMKTLFGDKLVYSDIFAVQQSDFSATASNVRGSGADLVCIVASNPEQSGNLLRAMADLGYAPDRCIVPGLLNNDLPKVAGAAAEGVFSQDVYVDSLDNELNRAFSAAYEAAYGTLPGKPEVLGFEAVWVLAQAIRAAGDAEDTEKVAAAIRSGEWTSPRGALRFDDSGQAHSDDLYRTVVRDGRVVLQAD